MSKDKKLPPEQRARMDLLLTIASRIHNLRRMNEQETRAGQMALRDARIDELSMLYDEVNRFN